MSDALTQKQIASACLSFRHDFGLLPAAEQSQVMWSAQEWWKAWQKEGCITRAEADRMVAEAVAAEQAVWTEALANFHNREAALDIATDASIVRSLSRARKGGNS